MKLARKPLIVFFCLLVTLGAAVAIAEESNQEPKSLISSQASEGARLIKEKLEKNSVPNPLILAASEENLEVERRKPTLVRLFQGLAFCLGVFFIGIHIYRKYYYRMKPLNENHMRILEKLALSNKSMLYLVEIEGKKIIVGAGADKLTMVAADEFGLTSGDAVSFEPEVKEGGLKSQSEVTACAA